MKTRNIQIEGLRGFSILIIVVFHVFCRFGQVYLDLNIPWMAWWGDFGTLTDGKIYMGHDGELYKVFNIKDGSGINDILIPAGIEPVIITGRTSKILENRCREIHITKLYQGISNKIAKLYELLLESNLSLSNIAYIGDDINDLSCMQAVKQAGGLVGCPADAVKKVNEIADFVSKNNGGNGAVREFIEWIVGNSL